MERHASLPTAQIRQKLPALSPLGKIVRRSDCWHRRSIPSTHTNPNVPQTNRDETHPSESCSQSLHAEHAATDAYHAADAVAISAAPLTTPPTYPDQSPSRLSQASRTPESHQNRRTAPDAALRSAHEGLLPAADCSLYRVTGASIPPRLQYDTASIGDGPAAAIGTSAPPQKPPSPRSVRPDASHPDEPVR